MGCLRYGEDHAKYILISCGCMLLLTNLIVTVCIKVVGHLGGLKREGLPHEMCSSVD